MHTIAFYIYYFDQSNALVVIAKKHLEPQIIRYLVPTTYTGHILNVGIFPI
jgi:hypothetical protein